MRSYQILPTYLLGSKISCCVSFSTTTTSLRIPSTTSSVKNLIKINNRSSTSLPMIFGDFFSSLSGGGGFNSKIDYDSIPYPVPTLASAASEGKVLEEIVKDEKTLELATFAGGCFWGLELAYQRVAGVQYTGE